MAKDNIRNAVFTGLSWKLAERIGAHLVTLLVSILLARLLTPDDFGTIALVNVFIALANVFVVSGFGNALIQKKNADQVDFSSVFFFNLGFTTLVYLTIFCTAPVLADYFGIPIICTVFRVLGLRIIVAGIDSVLHAYVSRMMMFRKFFFSTLSGTLGSAVVGIAMAYLGYGIWALVAQYLFSSIISSAALWFIVEWRPKATFSRRRTMELFQFGWKLLCSRLLDTGYQELINLVIGKRFSFADLGYYNNGNRYAGFIITNINSSISSVLFPALSKYQDDKVKLKAMVRRSLKTSSYLVFPALTGLIVVAKPLVICLLTEKWLPSVPFLQISCIALAFHPIHTANLEAIKAVGRSDLFLQLEIIKKIFGIAVMLLVIDYGVFAIAWSMVVTTLFSSIINAYPNRRILGYQYSEQIMDILPAFLLSVFMGGITYLIGLFIFSLPTLLLLIVQSMVGASVYIVMSWVLKIKSFIYVRQTLGRMLQKVR